MNADGTAVKTLHMYVDHDKTRAVLACGIDPRGTSWTILKSEVTCGECNRALTGAEPKPFPGAGQTVHAEGGGPTITPAQVLEAARESLEGATGVFVVVTYPGPIRPHIVCMGNMPELSIAAHVLQDLLFSMLHGEPA